MCVYVDMKILIKIQIKIFNTWGTERKEASTLVGISINQSSFSNKVEIANKNTGMGMNQDYISVGKCEDWVVQKMHKSAFGVQI